MQDGTEASVRSDRSPQDNIPQTKQQRDHLLKVIARYVEQEKPVGPLCLDELQTHCK